MSETKWENFTEEELACPCCGKQGMDAKFMDDIQAIRTDLGFPFPVTSGYRCPDYDRKVGNSMTPGEGPHTTGKAIDIALKPQQMALMIKALVDYLLFEPSQKLGGLGFNFDKGFMHIDALKDPETDSPRSIIWGY